MLGRVKLSCQPTRLGRPLISGTNVLASSSAVRCTSTKPLLKVNDMRTMIRWRDLAVIGEASSGCVAAEIAEAVDSSRLDSER
jgi:hypothetical protein